MVAFIDALHLTRWLAYRPKRLAMRGTCSHCHHTRDAAGRYCKACVRLYFRLRRDASRRVPYRQRASA